MSEHKLPKEQKPNAQKQASQIRHCLLQAYEYKVASEVATAATRPLLLYYSIMSLAISQILFKGSGIYSLDKARDENAHHGLLFTVDRGQPHEYSLSAKASKLRAKPMLANGVRKGTFELWQRVAREDPITSRHTEDERNGTRTIDFSRVVLTSEDYRIFCLPKSGINLLDCFKATPGIMEHIGAYGVASGVARGTIHTFTHVDGSVTWQLYIHPGEKDVLDRLMEEITMHPSAVNYAEIYQNKSGFTVTARQEADTQFHFHMPSASMWASDKIRFLPCNLRMNEFGYLYLGLYILGNYARYYPDLWMNDIEAGSPLAAIAEDFMIMAEWRMAQLTLSELSGTYYISDA